MSKIDLNDPRLTAYALNEMEPVERTEFEKTLEHDAAAQKAVEEIRALSGELSLALADEPVAGRADHDFSAAAILPGNDPQKLDGGQAGVEAMLKKTIRFPQVYFLISGLAAACFAVFFVFWQTNQRVFEAKVKHYVEVPLTPVQAEAEAPRESEPRPAPVSAGAIATGGSMKAMKERVVAAENRGATSRLRAAPAVGSANTEAYDYHQDNAYLRVADQPVSTFSADVDTASYTNVRRFLTEGHRPPVDAVRIEELVNYFPYHYTPPATGGAPFATSLEVAAAPWAPDHRLVRIGIKGREISDAARPAANLVFLLDVSGSMDEPNKLPLVKDSLRLLLGKLRADDRVAIVVYAGASGLALPSTSASHQAEILEAIDRLQAEGSTNDAAGIQLAYDIAKANFVRGGVNRVILATDGDFNVGVTSQGELVRLVAEKAKSGVFLSVLGFGMGNYKDSTLEQLADKGNGNYAYIDSLQEARKTLVEQTGGTLVTIAKDVKLQVEFNPAVVQAYRLIGYENRLLAREDFNNDQVDAGEIGAGHTVTALYEVVPVGVKFEMAAGVDPLKYVAVDGEKGAARQVTNEAVGAAEMLTVKVRYKEPGEEVSRKLEFPFRDARGTFAASSQDFKFAAAVAAFGMVLRDSPHKGNASLGEVLTWGRSGVGEDPGGYRKEFIGLVEQAVRILE